MKKLLFTVAFLAVAFYAFSTITIVDINGAGQFTSIQLAINNASPGDTIQVWPGTYNEAINLNKNLVLQGSGYENTILTGNFQATITMSAGKLLWFLISSTGSVGVSMSGGIVANCVISSCPWCGIWGTSGISMVMNCILYNNGASGVHTTNGTINVTNCIGIGGSDYNYSTWGGTINLSYSDGSRYVTSGNQGCINSDPLFNTLTDYHISQGSPCWNTGNPTLSDPDGSQSDMGYFGGPDCPIFPVVYQMTVAPNGNNINVQAKARANY